MKKFNELKSGTKLSIIACVAVALILGIFGLYTMRSQKLSIISDSDERLYEQVNDLISIIDLQIKQNQEKVDVIGELSSRLFEEKGQLSYGNNPYSITVTNQETNESFSIRLPQLIYGNRPLYMNYDFINSVNNQGTNTILQKIDQGYIRISTNVKNESGSNAVNAFIPNSSPVAQALDKGQTYAGRALVLGEYYLTTYIPFKVNGQIAGAYSFGLPEKDMSELKAIFKSKKYYTNGYPYAVDKNGQFVIHPLQESGNIANEDFF